MGLSKDLGTRHRAAVGISEVSDSLTIVVSEETGTVSYAREGRIVRDVKEDELIAELKRIQNPDEEENVIEPEKREG
jgi:diadenylate cyclase